VKNLPFKKELGSERVKDPKIKFSHIFMKITLLLKFDVFGEQYFWCYAGTDSRLGDLIDVVFSS